MVNKYEFGTGKQVTDNAEPEADATEVPAGVDISDADERIEAVLSHFEFDNVDIQENDSGVSVYTLIDAEGTEIVSGTLIELETIVNTPATEGEDDAGTADTETADTETAEDAATA